MTDGRPATPAEEEDEDAIQDPATYLDLSFIDIDDNDHHTSAKDTRSSSGTRKFLIINSSNKASEDGYVVSSCSQADKSFTTFSGGLWPPTRVWMPRMAESIALGLPVYGVHAQPITAATLFWPPTDLDFMQPRNNWPINPPTHLLPRCLLAMLSADESTDEITLEDVQGEEPAADIIDMTTRCVLGKRRRDDYEAAAAPQRATRAEARPSRV